VGDVLRRLEAGGRLDDTVILVTGDHGEECYEHGHWGHNAAFTPEQIRVPLVLHVPGLAPAAHDALTGHQDLAATFLEMLGVENPPADYSQGRSLLGPTADLFQVSCGWNQCALVDGAGLVVFGTEPYNARGLDVLDPDYREVADPARALRERSLALRSLMAEMSAFLR
jgi:membrane-anchored protein YejM (alkaline phosphatase superfamily)